MIIAVCIDDRNGMMFNKRRQSRDRIQQENLLTFCAGRPLWMSPYSAPLFDWTDAEIHTEDTFLENAPSGTVCFVENRSIRSVAERVEAVLLYRWNRAYPGDLYFDLDFSDFELEAVTEFTGTSHPAITRELYRKKGLHHGKENQAETHAH